MQTETNWNYRIICIKEYCTSPPPYGSVKPLSVWIVDRSFLVGCWANGYYCLKGTKSIFLYLKMILISKTVRIRHLLTSEVLRLSGLWFFTYNGPCETCVENLGKETKRCNSKFMRKINKYLFVWICNKLGGFYTSLLLHQITLLS